MASNHYDSVQVETVVGRPVHMLHFDDAAALGVALTAATVEGTDGQEASYKLAYAAGSTAEAPYWRMSIKFIADDKPPVLQPRVRRAIALTRLTQ